MKINGNNYENKVTKFMKKFVQVYKKIETE